MSLRPTWSTERVPGHPRVLHRKTLPFSPGTGCAVTSLSLRGQARRPSTAALPTEPALGMWMTEDQDSREFQDSLCCLRPSLKTSKQNQ